jgi:hypothetical protein
MNKLKLIIGDTEVSSINLKTNVSFFVILISVMFLAFVEGGNISKALFENGGVLGSEIQQIAFIILTIIILGIATLNPEKAQLAAYTASTLGLVVVISSFYNLFVLQKNGYTVAELVFGFALIISGVMMGANEGISEEKKTIAVSGIKAYKKKTIRK